MTLAKQILTFYRELDLNPKLLPAKVEVLNPYANATLEVWKVIEEFYYKYYSDTKPRGLILGINPGRLGAGATGIPFTDSYALEEHCDIKFPGQTRESSASFVYMLIDAYGGAQKFYQDWFIGAVSPLGFVRQNDKGNWVNWNYYDDLSLYKALRPFMDVKLKSQYQLCSEPKTAVILGTGKNHKFLTEINHELELFQKLIPLEHPRYIMQYKRKNLDHYLDKFVTTLRSAKPS